MSENGKKYNLKVGVMLPIENRCPSVLEYEIESEHVNGKMRIFCDLEVGHSGEHHSDIPEKDWE